MDMKPTLNFWKETRVTVTGGGGFMGKIVVRKLKERGCQNIFVPRSRDYDLLEKEQILRMYHDSRPDILLHLAAVVGGIGINRTKPGTFFYENAIMGIQLMEWGRRLGIRKFVAVGTTCSYPKSIPLPFKESDFWNGYPEETNAPYGLAKKMLSVQAAAYAQEFNFNAINPIPSNLYGPEDNFDLETSHVIPAMIRKFVEAQERHHESVALWGTGSPSRDFLYVEDAAEGILLAAERYDQPDPVNLGSGREISIRDLAQMISDLVRFRGTIQWDPSKPDGQPRRQLDIHRAQELFGFSPRISLEEGLRRTIEWYQKQKRD